MSKGFIFINGEVFDPRRGAFEQLNIAIRDTKVIGVGYLPDDKDDEFEVIDVQGCLIIPNTIDAFVRRGADDAKTLSAAALHGGVTGIAVTTEESQPLSIDSYTIAPITDNRRGEKMSELITACTKGAVAFSDIRSIENPILMKNLLKYTSDLPQRLCIRPLDERLSENGMIHEGYYSTVLGLKGISYVAEEARLARDIQLMESFGGKLLVGPLSSANSIELIRRAKENGLDIMACTAIPYLYFDHSYCDGYNTDFKVLPPLRESTDREALINGIKDGTIDIVVSDHKAVSIDEKRLEFDSATCGISSLDYFLPLVLNKLVVEEGIPLDIVLKAITINPMKAYNLSKKGIATLSSPSFTVIDPKEPQIITLSDIQSKGKNLPYLNQTISGKVKYTVINGVLNHKA